jgi:hypothetical protein
MSPRYGLRQEDAPLLPPTPIKVPKRAMFLLDALVKAGASGITTIEFPGVRVSTGILHLRRAGLEVQTLYESHEGEFAGRHGRFVLRSRVELITDDSPSPDPSPAHSHSIGMVAQ